MYDYATPARTLEQRREALEKANRHRVIRAAWKKAVKRHDPDALTVAELLADPPAEFEQMKVFDVLMALPKVGRVRVQKWLRQIGISPSKTLVGLSDRQRSALLAMLPRSAGRRGTLRP